MQKLSDIVRLWLPIAVLVVFGSYTSVSMILAHVDDGDDHEIGYDSSAS